LGLRVREEREAATDSVRPKGDATFVKLPHCFRPPSPKLPNSVPPKGVPRCRHQVVSQFGRNQSEVAFRQRNFSQQNCPPMRDERKECQRCDNECTIFASHPKPSPCAVQSKPAHLLSAMRVTPKQMTTNPTMRRGGMASRKRSQARRKTMTWFAATKG
jgi:hypothetical protein